jgi:hypothetical protein
MVTNGPGLDWFTLNDPQITFLDSYRRLYVSSQSATDFAPWAGSAPCEFDGRFERLAKDNGGRTNYFYRGEFYFQWTGQNYLMTSDSRYTLMIRFPESLESLEDGPGPYPVGEPVLGIWRDYCKKASSETF